MKKSTFKYLVIEDDKSIWKNISARMQKYLQWKPVPFTDSLQEAITLIDTHRLSYSPDYRIYTLYYLFYRLPIGKPRNPSDCL